MSRAEFARTSRWAVAAATWCILFAALHLFWAFGGSTGLASSAGRDLAAERPAAFVAFGLYGVALLLMTGAATIRAAHTDRGPRHGAVANVVVGVAGVGLLARGVLLELVLLTDLGGIRTQIGASQARWSQLLWNPWFALGGALFIATALSHRTQRRPSTTGR